MTNDQISFEHRIVKFEKERLAHIVECLDLLYDYGNDAMNVRKKRNIFETEKKAENSSHKIKITNDDLQILFPHIDKKMSSTTKNQFASTTKNQFASTCRNHFPSKDQVKDNTHGKPSIQVFSKPTPPSIPNVKLNVNKAKKYIEDLENFDKFKQRKSIKRFKKGFRKFDNFANTERSSSQKTFDPETYLNKDIISLNNHQYGSEQENSREKLKYANFKPNLTTRENTNTTQPSNEGQFVPKTLIDFYNDYAIKYDGKKDAFSKTAENSDRKLETLPSLDKQKGDSKQNNLEFYNTFLDTFVNKDRFDNLESKMRNTSNGFMNNSSCGVEKNHNKEIMNKMIRKKKLSNIANLHNRTFNVTQETPKEASCTRSPIDTRKLYKNTSFHKYNLTRFSNNRLPI